MTALTERMPGRLPSPRDPASVLGTHLVDWMSPEGLALLLSGEFENARLFYDQRTRLVPDEAEGWLGMGAALLGQGRSREAVTHLLQGARLDPDFPVGALVALVEPAPTSLQKLAEDVWRRKMPGAMRAAMRVMDVALLAAQGNARVYVPIKRERDAWQRRLDQLEHPSLEARDWRRVGAWTVILLVAGLAVWIGVRYWRYVPTAVLVQIGTLDYVNAQRVLAGSAGVMPPARREAMKLYLSALARFRAASSVAADPFEPAYMTARACRGLLALHPPWSEGQAFQKEARSAEALCRKLDPTGERGAEMERGLKARIAKPPLF